MVGCDLIHCGYMLMGGMALIDLQRNSSDTRGQYLEVLRVPRLAIDGVFRNQDRLRSERAGTVEEVDGGQGAFERDGGGAEANPCFAEMRCACPYPSYACAS